MTPLFRLARHALRAGFALLLVASYTDGAVPEEQTTTSAKYLRAENAVPGQYIVVMNKNTVPDAAALQNTARELAHSHRGDVRYVYKTLNGFAVAMSAEDAKVLSERPDVKYVEEDGVVTGAAIQPDAIWNLDRIDQRDLPLDQTYIYNATGAGVNAYILDSGIRRTHVEFGGRAFFGFDAIGDGQNGNDCTGHGTHVAGTVGSAAWGVAKQVKLYSVRVLDCTNFGFWSQIIAGIDWVTANHVKPAVANMSIQGGYSQSVNDAVTASINAGVTYVVASGNQNSDACATSPASTPLAITVNALDNNMETPDTRSSYFPVQKWLLAEVFFLAATSARFLVVQYHSFAHSPSLGNGPGDIDQIVRDNPQPNPSLHAIAPLVPTSKEAMPSLEHTNPTLASHSPALSPPEPRLSLMRESGRRPSFLVGNSQLLDACLFRA